MNCLDNISYAKVLLEEKIFIINEDTPFTWTSGITMPFYCDQRSLLSNILLREKIVFSLCEIIKKIPNFKNCSIVGVVSAGVPWASMIAHSLQLPLGYVRSQKKEHGKKNAVEGNIEKDSPVIIIEDLVSTAKSLNVAHANLMDEGFKPYCAVALFTYNFKLAKEQLEKITLPLYTLSDFKVLNSLRNKPIKLTPQQAELFFTL